MNSNQPICDTCWAKRSPERLPVRVPVRLRVANIEPCAYCGRETHSGIYIRDDPARVPYTRPEREP